MEFKNLSNTIKIPVIGLGTWTIGGGDEADTTYDKENISAIKTAIKLGITHIDNAEAYAQGHSHGNVKVTLRKTRIKNLCQKLPSISGEESKKR
ncbi:aldo/keto reductase [Candidatus Kuenenia stuttgartiensis]|uniref:NADP-dependent oxidoreductase domain-containing protein n=1 Tax=Kuenenia stuttgartiensis TaxID=174633 RepID=A0A2C9CF36_KUEST|nr:aldo/keto reductase [Candidatus Kuenenia stuttgartiensis]SOH04265.1 hypothetical protein KSMBR1_1766 [Candidatus Kuenenia stuttgartiensis]